MIQSETAQIVQEDPVPTMPLVKESIEEAKKIQYVLWFVGLTDYGPTW